MKTAVRDVMTSRVVWVMKDTRYKEMAARLRESRVSAFPVLDDEGKVIGVVSEADLLTKEALDGGYEGMPGVVAVRDRLSYPPPERTGPLLLAVGAFPRD